MSVSRPEAIASQPSRCGRVASANVSSNQRRMKGRKSAIQIKAYASAEAHLAQQQSAQRAPGILEIREDREVVVLGQVEGLAGQAAASPHGRELRGGQCTGLWRRAASGVSFRTALRYERRIGSRS